MFSVCCPMMNSRRKAFKNQLKLTHIEFLLDGGASYFGASRCNKQLYFFSGILQGIFWGLGNGGGTMISGALIEIYGIIDTFRAFAIAGTVVLAILVIIQYTTSVLEQREKRRQEYDLLSDSDSKSEGTNDGEETQPQPKE